MLASAIINQTGFAVMLCASNLVRSVATVVVPIARQRRVQAFAVCALELIRRAVTVLRKRRAHA